MLVLPIGLVLIQKYRVSPEAINRETVFPCPSNQYTNRALKVVAEKEGLNKTLLSILPGILSQRPLLWKRVFL